MILILIDEKDFLIIRSINVIVKILYKFWDVQENGTDLLHVGKVGYEKFLFFVLFVNINSLHFRYKNFNVDQTESCLNSTI